MRKFINGRRYDTETARLVGEMDNSYPVNDFNYYEESLYRKQTGEFFIHGKGNANSKYKKAIGNMFGTGEKIVPITEDEARKWVEENLEYEDYELYFKVAETRGNDDRTAISFLIPNDIYEQLKAESDRTGKPQRDIFVEALFKYFN